jgi:hypothetical protein
VAETAAGVPDEGKLQMLVEGETLDGKFVRKTVLLPLGPAGDGTERLMNAGLELRDEEGRILVDNVVFGSPAQDVGIDFDWEIVKVQVEADRPPKQLMFIPALLLLALVAMLQNRRRKAAPANPQPEAA